jgi:3-methylcrotonyl-CoA carboxylase alpha subunit
MRVLCGDETRQVDMRGSDTLVDGVPLSLSVEDVAPGTFVARQGGHAHTFHCARDGDVIHLSWKGATYRLEEESETTRAAHRQVSGGLQAPMPGKVIAVKVAPGQVVAKGEELLVVEAMKMENAIRAPREGRVKSVSAQLGQMVSPGVVLVELE